jgi:predicted O-linked N-acetylglucosamine transferase (SPINDLY family)
MNKNATLDVQGLKSRALQAYKSKNFALSATYFEAAYELDKNDVESLINLGVALKNSGRLDQAITKFKEALQLKPEDAIAWYNLGNTYLSCNKYQNATECYEKSLSIRPQYVDALLNLGKTFTETNELEKGVKILTQALQISPKNAMVACSLAEAHQRGSQTEAAIRYYKLATEHAPSYSEAYAGLAFSYSKAGRYHESVVANENALKIRPEYPEALNNLSMSLMEVGRHDDALVQIDRALKINPNHTNARYNRGLIRLLKGEYKAGFRDYEERYNPRRSSQNKITIPELRIPRWEGQGLQGKKILVWQEQGAGDAIQFARYARNLSSLGAEVWFAVNPGLEKIIATCPWISRVVLKQDVDSKITADYWAMALSLPHLLDVEQVEQVAGPIFNTDPVKNSEWKVRLSAQASPRIGLVWAGNKDHSNDRNRSLSIDLVAELLQLNGISWVVLQKDRLEEVLHLKNHNDSLTDLSGEINDYTDTASILKGLDLLITVDTSAVHLAGSLNVPTFLLLPANPDWRWGLTGEKTAWYGSVRLFRQLKLNEWSPVLQDVKSVIEKSIADKDTDFLKIILDRKISTDEALAAQIFPFELGQESKTGLTEQNKFVEAKASEGDDIARIVEKARSLARENSFDEAVELYEALLSKKPKQPDALYGYGRAEFGKGNFTKAADLMATAVDVIQKSNLENKNQFVAPWSRDLGVCFQKLGQDEKAAQSFYLSQAILPDQEVGKWLLKYWTRVEGPQIQKAVALHKATKEKQAEKIYKEILARDSNNGEALHLLGCIYLNRKDFAEAEKLIRSASRMCPSSHVYQRNLAALQVRSGRGDDAIRTWRHVITLDSIDENAIIDVANAFMEHGAYQDAIGAYKKSLDKNPNNARSHGSIGRAYTLLKSDDEAKAHLLKAEELDPKLLDPQLLLARIAVDQGNYEDAKRYIQNCKKISPKHPYVVWSDAFLGLGIYYETFEESQTLMKDFKRKMHSLEKYLNKAAVSEVENAIGYRQPFELAYFKENNRDRLEAYGQAMAAGMARWQKDKKIPLPKPRPKREKKRVGIVMGFFFNHSVWNALVNGWMTASDKEGIEFYVFHTRPISDKETEKAKSIATKFFPSPKNLIDWAKTIAESECDVLVYPEIGMENMTVKLASMRLAPVQVCSWGHAEGSGLPTLDYYITGDLIEPPNAQDNYVEKVVRLPNLGCYIEPWDVKPEEINPDEYGLDASRPWLVSPGSPYKYRPEDDEVWLGVAKRLPNAQLVFFMHTRRQGVSNKIHSRLERLFKSHGMELSAHAVFIPWMTPQKFFGLMKRSSVFMDTIGFSGFNTAQQGLECELPVVTIRGKFMRSLLATGLLERIGVSETIVSDKEQYIDLVQRLVQDHEYNESVRVKIREYIHKIYRDKEAIKGFEDFLKSVK